MQKILIVLGGVAAVAVGAFVGLEFLWPAPRIDTRPPLAQVPPLQPMTRTSTVVTPTAVAITAIQKSMEAAAPRNLTGNRNGQTQSLPINATIGWNIDRGPLVLTGRADGLTISTPLNGSLRANGTLAAVGDVGGQVGRQLTDVLGNVGGSLGRQVGDLAGKTFDQHAEVHGNVQVTARPTMLANWRIAPNLTGQAAINDVTLPIAGLKLSVANEVRPLVDKSVKEQIGMLETRIRNDPSFEQAVRTQWAKLCSSFALGGAGTGAPDLWLEVKPTRAMAAQPRVDATAVNLLIGLEAQTRVVASQTKPNCPFPAQLEIVPQLASGVAIGVPIDIPFTELNKLLQAQLIGKTFPDDKGGSVAITIRQVEVVPSGDQLLISLRVKAHEGGGFGFGAEANVHVWGKPQLDRENQILRLTDIALDVSSDAAFGLLGPATKAAAPYLKPMLASKAVVDLKPFAADARKKIEAVLADFQKSQPGVQADAKINVLRLDAVTFDDKILRVIAEAQGTVNVTVNTLP